MTFVRVRIPSQWLHSMNLFCSFKLWKNAGHVEGDNKGIIKDRLIVISLAIEISNVYPSFREASIYI